MTLQPSVHTRASLAGDLRRLGVGAGDAVMVHGALSRVGRMLHGPDALVGALQDVLGPEGTLLAYLDWDDAYGDLTDAEGRVLDEWRAHVPPFDPATSRAKRFVVDHPMDYGYGAGSPFARLVARARGLRLESGAC